MVSLIMRMGCMSTSCPNKTPQNILNKQGPCPGETWGEPATAQYSICRQNWFGNSAWACELIWLNHVESEWMFTNCKNEPPSKAEKRACDLERQIAATQQEPLGKDRRDFSKLCFGMLWNATFKWFKKSWKTIKSNLFKFNFKHDRLLNLIN